MVTPLNKAHEINISTTVYITWQDSWPDMQHMSRINWKAESWNTIMSLLRKSEDEDNTATFEKMQIFSQNHVTYSKECQIQRSRCYTDTHLTFRLWGFISIFTRRTSSLRKNKQTFMNSEKITGTLYRLSVTYTAVETGMWIWYSLGWTNFFFSLLPYLLSSDKFSSNKSSIRL